MQRLPTVYMPGTDGPYSSNYFSRSALDVSRRSDDTETDLLAAVGAALTRWEGLEDTVVQLFAEMLMHGQGARKRGAAYKALGSIESSANRRGALEQVAFALLDDPSSPLGSSIKRLFQSASEASRRRDEFAHGVVSNATKVTDETVDVVGRFLWAPRYNLRRNDYDRREVADVFPYSTSRYRYTSREIVEYGVRFTELTMALVLLLCEISPELKADKFPEGHGF